MLAFDAFIGNEDRHENNFDVIVRDGKNYAPPIYDNGGSLLAWAIDEELTDTKLRYQFDKAKPFRSHHAQHRVPQELQTLIALAALEPVLIGIGAVGERVL